MRITNEFIVCFDVSGTLVDMDDGIRHSVYNLLMAMIKLKCKVYIWSGAGVNVAESVAKRLNIAEKVECIEKGSVIPDLSVDDQKVTFGKANLWVPEWIEMAENRDVK